MINEKKKYWWKEEEEEEIEKEKIFNWHTDKRLLID